METKTNVGGMRKRLEIVSRKDMSRRRYNFIEEIKTWKVIFEIIRYCIGELS